MNDLTRILEAVEHGDAEAADQLLPLVYDELRRLAALRLAQEKPTVTRKQPTSSCRLSTTNCAGWPPCGLRRRSPARPCSRPPWFTRPTFGLSGRARLRAGTGAAISSPRPPLPCAASSWNRRGASGASSAAAAGAASPPTSTPCWPAALHRTYLDALLAGGPAQDVLALHEALEQLAAHDPVKAKLVEMRFFAGLTLEQAAECLGIAPRTADRAWRYARAWLYAAMAGTDSGEK
jgi:hypothetical protein